MHRWKACWARNNIMQYGTMNNSLLFPCNNHQGPWTDLHLRTKYCVIIKRESLTTAKCALTSSRMMTSSNGNIFLLTGPFAVSSPHKGQWCGASMFSLIYAWINGWVNNRETGDLIRHCAHYDVNVMRSLLSNMLEKLVKCKLWRRTKTRSRCEHKTVLINSERTDQ